MEAAIALLTVLNDHTVTEFDYITQPYSDTDTDSNTTLYHNGNIVLAQISDTQVALGITYDCATQIYQFGKKQYFATQATVADKLQYSKCLLLINSDASTYYNIRCQHIESQLHTTGIDALLQAELQFSALLLSKHYKSGEAWSYRRYILSHILRTDSNIKHNVEQYLANERAVCTLAATRHSFNYYAWSHRLWAYTTMLQQYRTHCNELPTSRLLKDESDDNKQFAELNPREYNVWHYRQELIKLYLTLYTSYKCGFNDLQPVGASQHRTSNQQANTASGAPSSTYTQTTCDQLLTNELNFAADVCTRNTDNQSIWMHIRQVIWLLLLCTKQHSSTKPNVLDVAQQLVESVQRATSADSTSTQQTSGIMHHLACSTYVYTMLSKSQPADTGTQLTPLFNQLLQLTSGNHHTMWQQLMRATLPLTV